MKYTLLIYEDEAVLGKDVETPGYQAMVQQHRALVGELMETGVFVTGSGLKPTDTATTLRQNGGAGRTVHDGPYAETREQLGGFYLVDVPDLDAAIAIARRIPLPAEGGSIEIRPAIG
jgi:hypothetical protein